MAKTAGSATTHYHYDQNGRLIAESDDSGSVIREHIALDGLPLALIDHGGSGPVIQTVHADHLGTPQVMTDASKTVVWDAVMTPFGVMHSLTGSAANDNRLPGQRREAETGLHYNYFRDYDPDLGRYIQSDPIGIAGGLNTYAYVGGDPVNYADPTGEFAVIAPAVPIIGPLVIGTAICLQNPECKKALENLTKAAIEAARRLMENCPPEISNEVYSERPRGFRDAVNGSEEWGRRNGIGKNEGRRRFHKIKQGDNMSKPDGDYSVNPDTGDVADPDGEIIGNLNDDY